MLQVADLVGAARVMVAEVVEEEDIGDGVDGGRLPLIPFPFCLSPGIRVFLHSAGVFVR